MANRLAELMKKRGFNVSATPASYNKFHKWSVEHQADFYAAAMVDVQFPWIKKPAKILEYDGKEPIWKAQWFSGGEANVYNACIEEQVRRGNGSALALIAYREDGRTIQLTFNDVKERVEQIARRMKADGIKKGDRVCVITTASEYPYLLFYAAHKIGATFVPMPTEIMDMALVKRLELVLPKIIFLTDGFLYNKKMGSVHGNLSAALKEIMARGKYKPKVIEIKYLGQGYKQSNRPDINMVDYDLWLSVPATKSAVTEPLTSKDITMILFTSGTTGTPKGTQHSYCAMIEDMLENAYASNLGAGDRSFWFTSPGWMMFPWVVTGANSLGATAVLYDGSPKIDGDDTMLKFVSAFKITHLGISPPLVVDVVNSLERNPGYRQEIRTLREIRYTSAPLAESIAKRLAKQGYAPNGACGGTDGCFCYGGGNSVTKRIGATMLPGLGIDVHVMQDRKGVLVDTKPGAIGNLVIKSPFPSMTNGLLNDDIYNTRFRATYFNYGNGPESKYWLHGDLASFDKSGYLTVHGRADDILVVHGSKLSPMDVQDAILRSNPEVQDAASISMSVKEGDGGELLIFAVLGKSSSGLSGPELEALGERIKDSVKEKINRLARPYRVFFVGGIPYTINNKPAFRIIKRAFMREKVGDTSTIRNPETIAEITRLSKDFISRR